MHDVTKHTMISSQKPWPNVNNGFCNVIEAIFTQRYVSIELTLC